MPAPLGQSELPLKVTSRPRCAWSRAEHLLECIRRIVLGYVSNTLQSVRVTKPRTCVTRFSRECHQSMLVQLPRLII